MIRKAVGAIVFQGDKLLIVHKTKINTKEGKQSIKGEWDFIKGGVEAADRDLQHAIIRELGEETGSSEFRIVKQLEEKICFDFPATVQEQIGYVSQETTMFLVEFIGDINSLWPNDSEISKATLLDVNRVEEMLTHQDTVDYFWRNVKEIKLTKNR
ncbi:NUDIX domain-containing protein [Paucisalibacillus sp. EB02]|uniref:NUDIX domain-containing protein n=1 Tax=Paucisalibacillus sp. EB02 TaxID=1347087 RepID=UPI0005A75C28|nr:NUDIX hydrolase [Paucisalibacillus sp. EB02]